MDYAPLQAVPKRSLRDYIYSARIIMSSCIAPSVQDHTFERNQVSEIDKLTATLNSFVQLQVNSSPKLLATLDINTQALNNIQKSLVQITKTLEEEKFSFETVSNPKNHENFPPLVILR